MGDAAVVGAGVAGLAAAVVLRRAGWHVQVLDERPLSEALTGSGLVLWPNAQEALGELGVPLPASPPLGLSLADSTGRPLAAAAPRQLDRRLGGCPRVVLRADLVRGLRQAALEAGAQLSYGRRLVAAAPAAARWRLSFADASELQADVVLGCDGIRSAVRDLLAPQRTAIRFRARVAYRGLSDGPAPQGTLTEVWGREGRFGCAPLPDGRAYWFADVPARDARQRLDLAALRGRLGGWSAPAAEVLAGADPSSFSATEVQDRPLLRRWPYPTVALLGDAAHAMTPDLGQGACQALEDAARLGAHLRRHPHPVALDRYVRSRRVRTGAVVVASRAAGMLAQPLPARAERSRAAALQVLPDPLVLLPATLFARARVRPAPPATS